MDENKKCLKPPARYFLIALFVAEFFAHAKFSRINTKTGGVENVLSNVITSGIYIKFQGQE